MLRRALSTVKAPAMLLLLSFLVAMTSCSDDVPDAGFLFTEMATLDTADPALGSTFTVYRPSSASPIRLVTRQLLDSDYVKPGDRVMITYRQPDDDPYIAGDVTLTSYRIVTNLDVEPAEADDSLLSGSAPFNVKSAWLTGLWLNVRALVPYEPGNVTVRAFASAGSDKADVYLILQRDGDAPTFEREQYFSMSVADFAPPEASSLTVHVYCPSNPTVESITMSFPMQR